MLKRTEMTCTHANEVPNICPCDSDCYCKTHQCKPRTKKVAVQKADVVEYAICLDEETWTLAKRKAEGAGIDIPSLFRYFARYCDYTRHR